VPPVPGRPGARRELEFRGCGPVAVPRSPSRAGVPGADAEEEDSAPGRGACADGRSRREAGVRRGECFQETVQSSRVMKNGACCPGVLQ